MNEHSFTAKAQFLVAGIIIAVDQITKIIVKNTMAYGQSIDLIGSFLRFTYIENPGMAFGIRFGGRWFFAVFSLLASFAIIYMIFKSRHAHLSLRVSLSLILGGAVGNLIDRFLFGRVVDFVDVDFFNIPPLDFAFFHFNGLTRWPVFNVADSAVSIGMVLLIYYMLFQQEKPVDSANDPGKNVTEH